MENAVHCSLIMHGFHNGKWLVLCSNKCRTPNWNSSKVIFAAQFYVTHEWDCVLTATDVHVDATTHTFLVWLLVQCCDIWHHLCRCHLIYHETAWSTLVWSRRNVIIPVKAHREYLLAFIFSIQNLTRFLTLFTWLQSSIDQAFQGVSLNIIMAAGKNKWINTFVT